MPRVSVILPTYNEALNIKELIEEIVKNLEPSFEIIVVDDDSPDGTWGVVSEIAKEDKRVRLLHRKDERGLSSAIAEGISLAKGEIVIWMDCDFSMPPETLPGLIMALDEYDIAVGSRYVIGGRDARGSLFRILTSRLFNMMATLLLRSGVTDLTSGFLAVKKKVFEDIKISGEHGDYCIDFLYKAENKGYRIKEVPYANMPRLKGETKTNPGLFRFSRHGIIYLSTVFRLRRNKNG
ncbi:polyprenol monophosphomannose synthase [bacterium]|nr:polyprenol monophosphomannose synthase [bacterium]